MIISKENDCIKDVLIFGANFLDFKYHFEFLMNKRVKLINKYIGSQIGLFYEAYLAYYDRNNKEIRTSNSFYANHVTYDMKDYLTGQSRLYKVTLESSTRVCLLSDNPNDFGYILNK